jgi:hypothetical protein
LLATLSQKVSSKDKRTILRAYGKPEHQMQKKFRAPAAALRDAYNRAGCLCQCRACTILLAFFILILILVFTFVLAFILTFISSFQKI